MLLVVVSSSYNLPACKVKAKVHLDGPCTRSSFN